MAVRTAEIPRPEHPRPQFEREAWVNLNGPWTFCFDFGKSGLDRKWHQSQGFEREITVPFCPESRLSGVQHLDFIEMMWYHRKLEIPAAWHGKKLLLHFGGVDYEAEVFIDGVSAGAHWGGSASFAVDITRLAAPGTIHDLVVHVKDDLRSKTQPSGKQCDVCYDSIACSYTRVTGIWQTVWLEAAAPTGLKQCQIIPDLDRGAFVFVPQFHAVAPGMTLEIAVAGETTVRVPAVDGVPVVVKLAHIKPWSPKTPYLYDVGFSVKDKAGRTVDTVRSYAGLRKVHIEGDRLFLNNEPLYVRFVLDQGYYPDGIWTAPSDAALKQDIELALRAGFNGARLHQKVFEERFHYWADKLGYLTWGESANWCMLNWTDKGCRNFLPEWREIVMRDLNHPSIIAWTPFNETRASNDLRQHRRFMADVYDLTKQLDPTRPVNDSSGHAHAKTDLYTVHTYALPKELEELFKGGAHWRNYPKEDVEYAGQPYLVDEFGGIKWVPEADRGGAEKSWGYGEAPKTLEEFYARLEAEVDVLLSCEQIGGYCYTQLTDIEQERNGLYFYDRTEKFDLKRIAAIFSKEPKLERKAQPSHGMP